MYNYLRKIGISLLCVDNTLSPNTVPMFEKSGEEMI